MRRSKSGMEEVLTRQKEVCVFVIIKMTEEWITAWKIMSAHTFPAEHIWTHWSKTHPSPPLNATLVKEIFYGQLAFPRAEICCINLYVDTGEIVLFRASAASKLLNRSHIPIKNIERNRMKKNMSTLVTCFVYSVWVITDATVRHHVRNNGTLLL